MGWLCVFCSIIESLKIPERNIEKNRIHRSDGAAAVITASHGAVCVLGAPAFRRHFRAARAGSLRGRLSGAPSGRERARAGLFPPGKVGRR